MRCIDPEKIIPISRSTTEVFKTGAWGSGRPEHLKKVSACRAACPNVNNITKALFKASQGDFDGALSAFLEESPLPGVCGSVCFHPCEDNCNRGQWDGEVSIRVLERAASELGTALPRPLTKDGRDHPVAVVGSGPAGLSAAYHLARMGHPVTLIESEDEPGGLLRWGIPQYRLSQNVLERDIARILSLDIRVRTNTRVDAQMLTELRTTHRAVFIAAGAQKSQGLDILGTDLDGVIPGVDFLKDVRRDSIKDLSGKVVVIGGGNVAIDSAMTALRLGAERVELVCLERQDEMSAHGRECEDALEEGIVFHNGWGPRNILGQDGGAAGVEFIRCTSVFDRDGRFSPSYDESTVLKRDADWVIPAIGQAPDLSFLEGIGIQGGALTVNDQTMETAVQNVFAGGDVVQTPGSVVESIASGKRAALAIHLCSKGMSFSEAEEKVRLGEGPGFSIETLFHPRAGWDRRSVVRFEALEPLFLDLQVPVILPRLDSALRVKGFEEINQPLNMDDAIRAAGRCFFCGTCTGCDRCFIYCPEICITPPREDHGPYSANPEYCKGCAVCAAVCPRGVMTMGEGT